MDNVGGGGTEQYTGVPSTRLWPLYKKDQGENSFRLFQILEGQSICHKWYLQGNEVGEEGKIVSTSRIP